MSLKMTKNIKLELVIACSFFMLAVALGAFGAHGLKAIISAKALLTYKTGIQYQFIHSIALFMTSIIGALFGIRIKSTFWIFVAGIVFFSFNCYLYAVSDIKTFAMLVPIGGILFLIAWVTLIIKIVKNQRESI